MAHLSSERNLSPSREIQKKLSLFHFVFFLEKDVDTEYTDSISFGRPVVVVWSGASDRGRDSGLPEQVKIGGQPPHPRSKVGDSTRGLPVSQVTWTNISMTMKRQGNTTNQQCVIGCSKPGGLA